MKRLMGRITKENVPEKLRLNSVLISTYIVVLIPLANDVVIVQWCLHTSKTVDTN